MTDADDDFSHPLITTEDLAALASDPLVRIIDGSWRMPGNPPAILDHERRRIPGAVFFDLDAVSDRRSNLPHMLPPADEFQRAMGALGISHNSRVFVYDDQGIFSAARVWWTFRAMGHARVCVLNGGLPKWLKEGRPVEAGHASPTPVDYGRAKNTGLARTAAEVREFLRQKSGVVLDARPAARFSGEAAEPRAGLRRGHMPGAVSLPHGLLLTETGELRPLDELATLFRERGVHAETQVVTTCGSGVTAAVLFLALERLGHRRTALYDGSWAEWGAEANDPALFPAAAG
jgi:thiosulfate/3-mercaptopyruvate sulfurtransferase